MNPNRRQTPPDSDTPNEPRHVTKLGEGEFLLEMPPPVIDNLFRQLGSDPNPYHAGPRPSPPEK